MGSATVSAAPASSSSITATRLPAQRGPVRTSQAQRPGHQQLWPLAELISLCSVDQEPSCQVQLQPTHWRGDGEALKFPGGPIPLAWFPGLSLKAQGSSPAWEDPGPGQGKRGREDESRGASPGCGVMRSASPLAPGQRPGGLRTGPTSHPMGLLSNHTAGTAERM